LRAAGVVAIVAFLVLDAVLVYFALTSTGPVEEPARAGRAPTSAPSPSAEGADPAAEEEEPAEPVAALVVPALSRLLAPASDSVAWRALTQACDSPVTVQRTEDSGVTWVDQPVAAEEARAVLALRALDEFSLRAVTGAGESCEAQSVESFSSGEFWAPATVAAASWFHSPTDPAAIVGQGGAVESPCAGVSALAAVSPTEAAVSCTDGALFLTVDAGASWTDAEAGDGVVAVAANASGYTVAKTGVDGCDGLQIARLVSDGPSPLSCVPAEAGTSVVMSSAEDALWLWAGEDLLVSADGGSTWPV
jgi:hypothetical protein